MSTRVDVRQKDTRQRGRPRLRVRCRIDVIYANIMLMVVSVIIYDIKMSDDELDENLAAVACYFFKRLTLR